MVSRTILGVMLCARLVSLTADKGFLLDIRDNQRSISPIATPHRLAMAAIAPIKRP